MGRCLGTRLHKLLPEGEVRRRVLEKRNMQKIAHDKNVKQRNFLVGDSVIVRNFGSGSKWIAGKVSSSRGPVSLQVLLNDGRTVHRHFDHVRSASSFLVNPGKPRHQSQSRKIHGLTLGLQAWKKQYLANKELNVQPDEEPEPPPHIEEQAEEPGAAKLPVLRSSARERHPPVRL